MNKNEFADRVRNCERRLYRVARTMLRSDADCEDAVQDALLRAWASLNSLRQEEYFETWLIRILINSCRSLARKKCPAEELPESIPAPKQEENRLFQAMLALPEKHRILLELHYIEGYRLREIARMTGTPEGTLKWRLQKGRALLKSALKEET